MNHTEIANHTPHGKSTFLAFARLSTLFNSLAFYSTPWPLDPLYPLG